MKPLIVWAKARPAFKTRFIALAFACILGLLASCDKNIELGASPVVQHSNPNVSVNPTTYSESNDTGEQNDILGLLKRKPEVIHNLRVRSEAIRAVNEIGERKQVEAIPVLLDQMFVIMPFFVFNHEDFSESYPCSVSLIKIGEPAVRQVQDQFLVAKSGIEQMVMLHVLINIKGAQFTSGWLDELQRMKLVSERKQHFVELKGWVLSHTD